MESFLQNYGLIREGTGNAVLKPIPIPHLRDDYILVRTIAVALNPTDWTTLDARGEDGSLVGCDYAGIVEQVGKAVTKPFKKGDRIAGFGHGGNDANHHNGAFARYISVKGDVQMYIPHGVSFEQAATTGCGIATAGFALHKVLKLPYPDSTVANETTPPVLIYGGSTATGTIAIQFAKMAGCKVYTTCSPKHFELVKSRGADMVYDYRCPEVGDQIRRDTNDSLRMVLDTVAVDSSASICASAFSSEGGTYCNLLGIDCPRQNVESKFFLGYDISGEEYIFEGDKYPARPETFAFAKDWYIVAETLWKKGKWKSHPENVFPGGLRGALRGIQLMREGNGPSGDKWVYRVDDTEWL